MSMDIQTFETIVILRDNLLDDKDTAESKYEEVAREIKHFIGQLPAIKIKTELLGRRPLAYEIRGYHHGYYLMFTYKSTSDIVKTKLEPYLRTNDTVIKFITTVCDKTYIPDVPDEDESEQPDRREARPPVDIFDLIFGIEN